ncbi:hypothetical protein GCM10007086_35320 [Photobacterium aphoticum]|nr:hypothetical protein GCM10007086_35320 [Photobacterium aphoticum]
MNRFNNIIISILILALCSGCTTTHNIYTGEDDLDYGEEFSIFNTIMLPVAIAGIVLIAYGAAHSSSSGSSSISCNGSYCNYDAAWDYLPGSSQYRCRSTENGQFVLDSYCYGQYKQDNWY